MGQRKLKANSLQDMTLLATCILTTPAEHRPALMAVVHDLGLMRSRGVSRPLVWLVRKTKGRVGLTEFFTQLQTRSPVDVDAMVEQTAEHVLQGDDKEEESSVGGFSQREIDALQDAVSFSLLAEVQR